MAVEPRPTNTGGVLVLQSSQQQRCSRLREVARPSCSRVQVKALGVHKVPSTLCDSGYMSGGNLSNSSPAIRPAHSGHSLVTPAQCRSSPALINKSSLGVNVAAPPDVTLSGGDGGVQQRPHRRLQRNISIRRAIVFPSTSTASSDDSCGGGAPSSGRLSLDDKKILLPSHSSPATSSPTPSLGENEPQRQLGWRTPINVDGTPDSRWNASITPVRTPARVKHSASPLCLSKPPAATYRFDGTTIAGIRSRPNGLIKRSRLSSNCLTEGADTSCTLSQHALDVSTSSGGAAASPVGQSPQTRLSNTSLVHAAVAAGGFSSPVRAHNAHKAPQTPTPFKRAYRRLERVHGRVGSGSLFDDDAIENADQLSTDDLCDIIAGHKASDDQMCSSAMGLDFNTTPSKALGELQSALSFSPIKPVSDAPLGQLFGGAPTAHAAEAAAAATALNSPKLDLVSVVQQPSSQQSVEVNVVDDFDSEPPLPREDNDRAALRYLVDELVPDTQPAKLSPRWLEITCGLTKPQREMTAAARNFLV